MRSEGFEGIGLLQRLADYLVSDPTCFRAVAVLRVQGHDQLQQIVRSGSVDWSGSSETRADYEQRAIKEALTSSKPSTIGDISLNARSDPRGSWLSRRNEIRAITYVPLLQGKGPFGVIALFASYSPDEETLACLNVIQRIASGVVAYAQMES